MKSHYLFIVFLLFEQTRAFHSNFGQPCSKDLDCMGDKTATVTDGWELCGIPEGKTSGSCIHKDLWPLKTLEFWGMIVSFWVLWLANMAGVGGAGMLVPVGIFFFKMDPKNAIAISNFSIFLSSLLRWLLNSGKSHPLKKGRGLLVDYNLGVLMLPGIISGVSIGSIMNALAPQVVILVCYVLLLAYVGSGLFKKAREIYKAENKSIGKVETKEEIELGKLE
jgi:hypothetical protein